MRISSRSLAPLGVFSFCFIANAAPQAIILRDAALPNANAELSRIVQSAVEKAGYQATARTVDELLANPPSPTHPNLLVLPQSRALPQDLAPLLNKYLDAGGNIMALGTPMMKTALVRLNGKWVDAAAQGEIEALTPPSHGIFDFGANADPTKWERSSNQPSDEKRTVETVTANGRTASALHVTLSNLTGWDTLLSPQIDAPLPPGDTATVFSARGGPHTHALAVEWREKDNSRWIAIVPLTDKWRRFSLSPDDFKAWDKPAAHTASVFNPQNAARLVVGLAFSHGATGGAQEYWMAQIGSGIAEAKPETLKPFDTLAPDYKFFPMHGALRAALLASPHGELLSSHPRPEGSGFVKNRDWRQIALLKSVDAKTYQWRGTPATLMLRAPHGNFPGALWASFTAADVIYYRYSSFLEDTARRMREGVFLLEGGAEFYTVLPGEKMRFGANVVNLGETTKKVDVRLRVSGLKTPPYVDKQWPIEVKPGEIATCETEWTPQANQKSPTYFVQADIFKNPGITDIIRHEVRIWEPPAKPNFVTVKDGHFQLGGKLWRINGVNYMPSSGIASEDGFYYEHWLSRQSYDAEIVERDLQHIEEIGFNAVSIFIYTDCVESRNLLDFLRRCRVHHLKVNLSLRPGLRDYLHLGVGPAIDEVKKNIRAILEASQAAQDDTVFAYEMDWEPNFGDEKARRVMDPQWQGWVKAKYGDLAAAEKAWNIAAPRDDKGELITPNRAQLQSAGGEATKLVADYRHFLDDWLASTYGALADEIRRLAPRQLVSFRSAAASNPVVDGGENLPYQFEGMARCLDFLSPEIYGQMGDDDKEKGVAFEIAYAHAVAPQKPFIIAESGFNGWNAAHGEMDEDGLQKQADYYARLYKILREGGADGIFWWWYPGGFRVGENSDFGLINPAGTDRPATKIVRREGPLFLNAPLPKKPDVFFDFNRDAHPDGVPGIYKVLKESFFAAQSQGKTPGLRPVR